MNCLLYSMEMFSQIEDGMETKELDQSPQWGTIIGTGHQGGGDFPFQKIQ